MRSFFALVGVTIASFVFVALGAIAISVPSSRSVDDSSAVQTWRPGARGWEELEYEGLPPNAVVRQGDGRIALRDVTTMPGAATLSYVLDPTTRRWSRETAVIPYPTDGPIDAPPGAWIRLDATTFIGLPMEREGACTPELHPDGRALPELTPCPDRFVYGAMTGDGTIVLVSDDPQGWQLAPSGAAWSRVERPPGTPSQLTGGPSDELLLVTQGGQLHYRAGSRAWQTLPPLERGRIANLAIGRGGIVLAAGGLLTEPETEVLPGRLALRIGAAIFALVIAIVFGAVLRARPPAKKWPIAVGLVIGLFVLPGLATLAILWIAAQLAWA